MQQNFEHQGLWWDPADPSDQWVGTLSFDRRDGITLSLIEPLRSPRFGGAESPALIHGVTTDGKAVSLLRCYEAASRMNFGGAGALRTIAVSANALIFGFHASEMDPLLSAASLSLRHLSEWWGRTGLEQDTTVERPNVLVRYTAADPLRARHGSHEHGRRRVLPAEARHQRHVPPRQQGPSAPLVLGVRVPLQHADGPRLHRWRPSQDAGARHGRQALHLQAAIRQLVSTTGKF